MCFYQRRILILFIFTFFLECGYIAQAQPLQTNASNPERLKHTLSGHLETVSELAFSPDGKLLVSVSRDGMLILWNTDTLEMLRTIKQERDIMRSVAFSPDGALIAVGSHLEMSNGAVDKQGFLTLWDVNTGERKRRLTVGPSKGLFGESSWVLTVAFTHDGKAVAGGCADGTIRLWDTLKGKELKYLNQSDAAIATLAFSSDGQIMASGSRDGTIILWETKSWKAKNKLTQNEVAVRSIGFSPDGKTLAGSLTMLKKQLGVSVVTLEGARNQGDDTLSASGYDLRANGSTLKLWDVETGKEKLTLARSRELVPEITFSPDGQKLACAVLDKTIRLVTIKTGEVVTLNGHTDAVISIAFSSNGRTVASAGKDKSVKLWDVSETK